MSDACITMIGTRIDRATVKSLRQVAADEETKMQALIAEGLHYVLTKRGREPSEDLKRIARVV